MTEKSAEISSSKMNIAEVTSRLMKLIIQLPAEDKIALLRDIENRIAAYKRSDPRQPYIAEIDFAYRGRPVRGFIENISYSGVFILSLEKPEKDSDIVMTFLPPDGGKSVKMTGRVVRIQEEGFAVAFNDKLNDLLKKYKDRLPALDLHIR